jgi:phosphate transport system permease protein
MAEQMTERQSFTPDDQAFTQGLLRRHRRARLGRALFFVATLVGMLALLALFLNILDETVGMVAIARDMAPEAISETPLAELDAPQLAAILGEYNGRRLRVIVRDELSRVDPAEFTSLPMRDVVKRNVVLADDVADLTVSAMSDEQVMALLAANLPQEELYEYVMSDVVGEDILKTWTLTETLFHRDQIDTEYAAIVADENPSNPELQFKSWLSWDFITSAQSSFPELAGVRTAIIGTLWIIAITMLVAFPLGVGAAIYLEEYAQSGNALERLIETNIRNLAGVPSIIYGLLGLAIFVRVLEPITSGAFVGVTDSNGRTIISASLTMALLILPVIIISAQEAIRAVPQSIREASYGLGATKWQTIWRQVLPASMPGILTGTILSLSRAIGETAPLIVIGASAVIFVDPSGPFSKFTALPIQIWQWTARPQDEFRNIAAAAIVVLLILLVIMNSVAIILRQRLSKKY